MDVSQLPGQVVARGVGDGGRFQVVVLYEGRVDVADVYGHGEG